MARRPSFQADAVLAGVSPPSPCGVKTLNSMKGRKPSKESKEELSAFGRWMTQVLQAERVAVLKELEARHTLLLAQLQSGHLPAALPSFSYVLGTGDKISESPKNEYNACVLDRVSSATLSPKTCNMMRVAAIDTCEEMPPVPPETPEPSPMHLPGATSSHELSEMATVTIGIPEAAVGSCPTEIPSPPPLEPKPFVMSNCEGCPSLLGAQCHDTAATKHHFHARRAASNVSLASRASSAAVESIAETVVSNFRALKVEISTLAFLMREGDMHCLAKLVRSFHFETACAVVVVGLAAVMAFEVQYQGLELGYQIGYCKYLTPAAHSWPWAETTFEVLNWVFGILFCLEMVVKVLGLGRHVFKDRWNIFDFLVTFLWILEMLADNRFFNLKVETSFFRVARLLRLARFVRLVKTIRMLDALYLIRTALTGSISALGWSCTILFLAQVLVAFFLNQVLYMTYFNSDDHPDEERREVFAYFGTFSRAVLSTFEMTLANWPPVCRLLAESVSEWFIVFCLIHKLTIGFALVGVINGVFIQETFKCASDDDLLIIRQKEKATATHIRKMQKLFATADLDGNGCLDRDEFREVLQQRDVRTWLAAMDYDLDDTDVLFDMLDTDRSNTISPEEFVHGITKLRGNARSVDVKKLLNPELALRTSMTMSAIRTDTEFL